MKTLLLLSGGMDSVTLLYDLCNRNEVVCLAFDYGQKHKKELECAKYHADRMNCLFELLKIPELGGLSYDNWIVPNRNAIFISIATNRAVKYQCVEIAIGCNKDDNDMFPDCRRAFIDSMNASLWLAGYACKVVAPYIDCPKWMIRDVANQFGIDPKTTWSCYRGLQDPCGECPACKKAFK